MFGIEQGGNTVFDRVTEKHRRILLVEQKLDEVPHGVLRWSGKTGKAGPWNGERL